CQETTYLSKRRSGHTATFIDNKLYILGVKDLSSTNKVPAHYNAASAKGGANNNTLFICGEFNDVKVFKVVTAYTFNPQNNSWNILKVTRGTS
ncbi:6619_t:CDS:2, partial [Rhizophagus irregularis]